MTYFVRSSAVEDFERIFTDSIEDSIRKLVNKKFLLKENQEELSISFYDNYLVIIKIKNETVTELIRYSYLDFIPDRFIYNLSTVRNLPPRLKRYNNMGINRFRKEIKESLIDGKIVVENNNVFWIDYNYNLKISKKSISLDSIVI